MSLTSNHLNKNYYYWTSQILLLLIKTSFCTNRLIGPKTRFLRRNPSTCFLIIVSQTESLVLIWRFFLGWAWCLFYLMLRRHSFITSDKKNEFLDPVRPLNLFYPRISSMIHKGGFWEGNEWRLNILVSKTESDSQTKKNQQIRTKFSV